MLDILYPDLRRCYRSVCSHGCALSHDVGCSNRSEGLVVPQFHIFTPENSTSPSSRNEFVIGKEAILLFFSLSSYTSPAFI